MNKNLNPETQTILDELNEMAKIFSDLDIYNQDHLENRINLCMEEIRKEMDHQKTSNKRLDYLIELRHKLMSLRTVKEPSPLIIYQIIDYKNKGINVFPEALARSAKLMMESNEGEPSMRDLLKLEVVDKDTTDSVIIASSVGGVIEIFQQEVWDIL